jgi:hypothetical protein
MLKLNVFIYHSSCHLLICYSLKYVHAYHNKLCILFLIKDTHSKRERILRHENEHHVAFFATLSNRIEHVGIGQSFVFDRVVTNVGSCYNNIHGNFIAPVSGTYVFRPR